MMISKSMKSLLRDMCRVQLKVWKNCADLLLSGLNEVTDLLAMAHSVIWYQYVSMRVNGYALRRAIEFEGEVISGMQKMT